MLSRVSMDGDKPPCRQNISDSTYKGQTNKHQKQFQKQKLTIIMEKGGIEPHNVSTHNGA